MASEIDPSAFDPAAHAGGVAAPGLAALHRALNTARGEISALQRSSLAIVNVREWGAVGDGVTDDGPALQAAYDYARAARPYRTLAVYHPAGTYVTRRPLNTGAWPAYGMSNGDLGLTLFGDGMRASRIVGVLDTPHPILDMSGNGRGTLRDLSVSDGDAGAGSASCAILLAGADLAGDGGFVGNYMRLHNVFAAVSQTRADAVAGVIVHLCDVSSFHGCVFNGRHGMLFTAAPPDGMPVTSAYFTLSTQGWSTHFELYDCTVTGRQAAMWNDSYGQIMVSGGYMTCEGPGPDGPVPSIVKTTRPGLPGALIFQGTEFEDQRSVTAVPLAMVAAHENIGSVSVRGGRLDVSGPLLYIAAGKSVGSCVLDAVTSYADAPVFGGGGRVDVSRITGPRRRLGAVAAHSGPFTIGGGGMSLGELKASLPAEAPWTTEFHGVRTVSAATRFGYGVVPARPNATVDISMRGMTPPIPNVETLSCTDTIPADLLAWRGLTGVGVALERIGVQQRNGPSGGRLRLQLAQGATTVDVLDWQAMPAMVENERFQFEVRVFATNPDGTGLFATASASLGDTRREGGVRHLSGLGFVTSADIAVKALTTSAGDAPYDTNMHILRVF